MKIGIVTYHRAHNYGALLQAFALKKFLILSGKDVEIIDYWPSYHEEMYKVWSWKIFWKRNIRGKLALIKRYLLLKQKKQKRAEGFIKFIDQHILPVSIPPIDKPFDLVIYGSDQIWRNQNLTPLFSGFNDVYFGNELIPGSKKITYSASMGELVKGIGSQEYLKRVLTRFDAISVREYELKKLIQPLTKLKVYQTLDPVFLLSIEQWNNIIPAPLVDEPYLLYYNLQASKKNNEIVNFVSDSKRLRVIQLTGSIKYNETEDIYSTVGPLEFLSLIKYADFIVSSSFHGIAFSILMKKQFIASLEKNAERVISLLNAIGLKEQYINCFDELTNLKPIKYEEVEKKLSLYKESSINYLHRFING